MTASLSTPPPRPPQATDDAADVFPASYAQARLWLLDQMSPNAAYAIPWVFTIPGAIDPSRLQQAFDQLVARHESFRTTFALDGDTPVQRVHARLPVTLHVDDLSALPRPDAEDRADQLATADAVAPFDLSTGPLLRARLIRFGPQRHWLCLTVHHIVIDEWSSRILLRDLAACYDALNAGLDVLLPPLPIQYADYAVWQREWVESGGALADAQWWARVLESPLPVIELPLDHARPEGLTQPAGDVAFTISPAIVERVTAVARAHHATPFMVCLAAYAAFLARHTGQHDLIVGTPVTERHRVETQDLIGIFLNMLALRFDLDADLSFDELVGLTRTLVLEAMQHQDVPFEHLVELVQPPRLNGRHPVFQVSFVYVAERDDSVSLGNVPIEAVPGRRAAGAKFDLSLFLAEQEGGLNGTFAYRSDLLDRTTVDRMSARFITLLEHLTAAPATAIRHAPLLPAAERTLLLETWNDKRRTPPPDTTLHALVERQVAATPDRVAVRGPEGEWTFRALDAQARRIARLLHDRGIGSGAVVAVCMDRSLGMLASALGVLQAGAAYLPIDTINPASRIAGMLEDADTSLVLVGPGTPDALADPRWELLQWDTPAEHSTAAVSTRPARPSDPAYVLFTSGSTGRPKGAVIPHSAIVNYLTWVVGEFHITADDVILQKTSISFDVSVREFWAPLVAGAQLVLTPPGSQLDPDAMIATMGREHVTILQAVPTLLRALIDTGHLGIASSLRLMCCGGEALTWDLVVAFRRAHHATLANFYGPTETTIGSAFWVVNADTGTGPVPIGQPIANTQLYVLDRHGELAPIGVPGELCIAGAGVGLGYMHRPDLTAQRFLADPFRPGPGRTMYRTGDLCRWRNDGLVEYLGRLDRQVKVRGFRIEPGEIEAALHALPSVAAAVVLLHENAQRDKRLVAHVELVRGSTIDATELRRLLKENLPDFMVPAVVHLLPRLPLLSSGKIDRAALALWVDDSAARTPTGTTAARPGTTLEFALQSIWARLLGVPAVGLDDDFFELGGHSLLAARMVHELERDAGFRLPLATLFDASTIRALLPHLRADTALQERVSVRQVQPGVSHRTPFFMLTGDFTGGGFYCRGLAATLGPERPFYAINPIAPGADVETATIEGMAAVHAAEIRRIQPSGPYRLGGYCIGGLVAYEVARHLQAAQCEVELLLMIDVPSPDARGWMLHRIAEGASRWSASDADARLTRLGYLNERLREITSGSLQRQLGALAGYPFRVAARSLRRSEGASPRDADRRTPQLTMQRIAHHHSRARNIYQHQYYAGRVDILVSTRGKRRPADQIKAWQRVAPAAVLAAVDAGHDDIVFTRLPEFLRAHIDRVEHQPGAEP